jgi:hypothetical protein
MAFGSSKERACLQSGQEERGAKGSLRSRPVGVRSPPSACLELDSEGRQEAESREDNGSLNDLTGRQMRRGL